MRKLSLILAAVLLLGMPVCAEDPHGGVVYSWKNSGKQIALTFDDGPHPQQTPEILAILEDYGIRATFFVIGQNATVSRWSTKRVTRSATTASRTQI